MEHLNVIATVLGGVVLALGLGSKWLERSPLPPTLLALVLGIVLGPELTDVVDLSSMGDRGRILEGVARVTLGIGLVGVALRVPREFPRRNWREMSLLIVLGMGLMWAVCTTLVYLILQVPLWMAALVAAIITATDPVAATPIVTGELAEKNVPERIRHLISLESGANDGLAYLFVFLPFLMMTRPAGEAIAHWLSRTLAFEVGVATVFGLASGYAAAKLLQFAERRGAIDEKWRLVYTAALALLMVGAGRLIGTDEVLVVFAAGVAFAQVVSAQDRQNEERGQEAINRFFSIPVFVVIGIALPWDGWASLGWSGPLLAVAVLLLRRPLAMLVLAPLLPSIRGRADAMFVGWFGPIAVAAVYYATLIEHKLGEPLVWHAVSLVVFASVLAHGVTASPLTRIYGRYAQGKTGDG